MLNTIGKPTQKSSDYDDDDLNVVSVCRKGAGSFGGRAVC